MPLSFLLVIKAGHVEALALAHEACAWLLEQGASVTLLEHPGAEDLAALHQAAGQADVAVVFGGDGTFVGVARSLAGSDIGLMGINFGRVGFLTEIPAADWKSALEAVLSGRQQRTDRLLLAWKVGRRGRTILSGHAVNEVVVGRGSLARIVTLHLSVQGLASAEPEDIGWIKADGIIVASPLGSSAYSLSSGGPLVHPELSAVLVTAVVPFLSGMPPLAVPGEACIRLQCSADGKEPEICLTVDGQEGHMLEPGDLVSVQGLPRGLHQYSFPERYLQRLRSRGFVRNFPFGHGHGESA